MGGGMVTLYALLALTLYGGERAVEAAAALPVTCHVGVWLNHRADLKVVALESTPVPVGNSCCYCTLPTEAFGPIS